MGNLLNPEALVGVDAALSKVVKNAVARFQHDVRCTEGVRTKEKQTAYYAQGRKPLAEVNNLRKIAKIAPMTESENKRTITQTMNSKHLTGKAVDLVPIVDKKARCPSSIL